MVEVVNMRTCKPTWGQEGDVRIDRGTKWGNPFPLPAETSFARDCVIARYEVWFQQQERDGKLIVGEVSEAKRLGCWCKPKRCHGDYIKKRIDEYNGTNEPTKQITLGEV